MPQNQATIAVLGEGLAFRANGIFKENLASSARNLDILGL